MQRLSVFMTGVGAGVLLAVLVVAIFGRWAVHRIIRRARDAERRAKDAERLADLGAMTSGLAHEIKNPLSTIGLNAQLLAEGIEDASLDEETRGRLIRRVGSLRREVERLRGTLSDFLQFAGELRLSRGPADLAQVVDELADFFLPQAEHHGVRMRAEAAGPLWTSIDVPLVKQAILNLLLNAVQAMSPGGSAVPAGTDGRPKELILRAHPGKDPGGTPIVQLHVIDTGPGIPPEAKEKMFQPYFTTKSGGTGLGLPTTRRLIEAHGGRLEVYTELGQGTDFTITLPAEAPPGRTGSATGS
ncbi:MAG TPA: HAMP domain-containing sensor histidine kinase [Phycisphaerales bacterium]|nr:HAMP domain-containing sensor histidine kinase [Phycisphaerales bacterium]